MVNSTWEFKRNTQIFFLDCDWLSRMLNPNHRASPERQKCAYELNSAAGNIDDAIVESVAETPVSTLVARIWSCGDKITLTATRNDNPVKSSNDGTGA